MWMLQTQTFRPYWVTGYLHFIATFKKQIISFGSAFFPSLFVRSPTAAGEAIHFSERY